MEEKYHQITIQEAIETVEKEKQTNRLSIEQYIMPFGKYAGEYIADLAADKKGKAYLEWLIGMNIPQGELLDAIQYHMEETR